MSFELRIKIISCKQVEISEITSLMTRRMYEFVLIFIIIAVQCAITCGHHDYVPKITQKSNASISLKDIIGDGFMWAVPKTRRPVEVRLSRKFGFPEKHWKMLVPKKNLLMCPSCGHDYVAGLLCSK